VCGADPKALLYKGYAEPGTSPLTPLSPFSALAQALDGVKVQRTRLATDTSNMVVVLDQVKDATVPLAGELSMTQKTFFTSYVTPIVGYADFATTNQSFWEPYVGIQVYLFPNPVDEPMWTNGKSDFRRLFSLELGACTQGGTFGPQSRYTTMNGVPPVFAGLAAQPIPYVTASIGGALLGTKSNELPQAATSVVGSLYFGLSVQANVPDTVRSLSSSSTTTTGGGSQ
jgi:hypothetical protein